MKKINFIDLFGAPGGLSLGLKMDGLKPLAALDNFEYGLDTFAKNFPRVPKKNIVLADASKKDVVKYFKKCTGLRKSDVDIIVGGPPCQGFSTMGRIKTASLVKNGQRKGNTSDARFINDKRNNLYKSFIKFVKYFQPKAVVMENVLGMQSYKNGLVVDQIKEDFRNVGYKNVSSNVLNAADYGTPQIRKRIFFIGTRKKCDIVWPKKTHFEKSKFDRSLIDTKIHERVSVWDAIGDLPLLKNPERGKKIIRDAIIEYSKSAKSDYQTWARKRSKHVHNHITRWHRRKDISVFSRMKPGGRWLELSLRDRKLIGYSDDSFLDKWKRLSPSEPSWTVVSHLHKDGYMYIHPTQNRTISVREAARLQSFPDSFVFCGPRGAQFKQIGNAVPPLLAKAVGKTVLKILKEKK